MSLITKLIAMFGGAIPVEFVLAGGGGSGGSAVDGSSGRGGGGGAGRLFVGTKILGPGSSYAVTIGAGGAARPAGSNTGLDGGNSSAFGLTAPGGGGGAYPTQSGGRPGGSGGGGGIVAVGTSTGGAAVAGTPDAGLGFAGAGGNTAAQGAGGGAGGAGVTGGPAGAGIVSSISGSAVEYCRGGFTAAAATPGSGGGGGNGFGTGISDAGADGIFIARYWGPQRATGGTITSVGGWTIHTFTTAGTFAL